jgi:hypothetical protein
VRCGRVQAFGSETSRVPRSVRGVVASRWLAGTVRDVTRTDRVLARTDGTAVVEHLDATRDTVAVWDYAHDVDHSAFKLYRQGRVASWTVDDLGLDGHRPPDIGFPVERDMTRVPKGSPFAHFDEATFHAWDNELLRYTLSQTLHGEHMGVLCGAALCEVGPTWDIKLFAATQTADEARHLEAFTAYVDLLGGPYPVNGHLHALFRDALTSREWDLIYIAAQVMVEGMALGAFGWMSEEAADDKLRTLLRLTLADEARHVAFGVHALGQTVAELSAAELSHRVDFLDEAAHALADRLVPVAVADRFGLDVRSFVDSVSLSPSFRLTQSRILRHIAPLCAKLGVLDADGGRLRTSFAALGMLDEPNHRPVRRSLAPRP